MEFFEVINRRRSIRQFSRTPVEQEKIEKIVEAALRAPQARNARSAELLVVTDAEKLARLAKAKPAGAGFVQEAPLGIVVLSDPAKVNPAIEDAAIVAVFIQLAAQALGLGSCWAHLRGNSFDENMTSKEYVANLLGIPPHLDVECILAIGYPGEQKEGYAKNDLPYRLVHYNKY